MSLCGKGGDLYPKWNPLFHLPVIIAIETNSNSFLGFLWDLLSHISGKLIFRFFVGPIKLREFEAIQLIF